MLHPYLYGIRTQCKSVSGTLVTRRHQARHRRGAGLEAWWRSSCCPLFVNALHHYLHPGILSVPCHVLLATERFPDVVDVPHILECQGVSTRVSTSRGYMYLQGVSTHRVSNYSNITSNVTSCLLVHFKYNFDDVVDNLIFFNKLSLIIPSNHPLTISSHADQRPSYTTHTLDTIQYKLIQMTQ